MWKILSFIMLFMLMLYGCLDKEIIDDVNLVMVIGYDVGEGNKIKGTIVAPEYKKEQPVDSKVMTVESDLSRDLISDLQKESPAPLVYGKLQFALYSEDVAKQGIEKYVDSLERDASVGSKVILAVCKGEAKNLLEGKYGQQGTATYFRNLVEHNMHRENLPIINLHTYLRNFRMKGKDPSLPLLEKKNDHVKITGLALFQKDKMVGEIENDQLFYFKLLSDRYVKGIHTITMDDGKNKASIESIRSKRRANIDEKNPFHLTIELEIEGYLREYSEGTVRPEILKKAEKAFEKEIVKNSMEMIDMFKEKNIDPVGLGEEILSHSRGLRKVKNWRDIYSKMKVDVHADVKITETGVVQ
jgi:germination protein, Ger(x)C family